MDIKLNNLSKRYQGNLNYTLENINLEIASGEFVAFLGPSGCGKTTMLRMIAGLNSITKGDLFFGQTKVNKLEPKDRNIAMVFQSYALYPHMTVYKNMAYSLQVRKIQKQLIDRRVKDVAKILEISDLLYNKPSEISGGQRQRVALGRAIVRKPAIFLMDEPLSNLDAKLRDSMRVELVKIHKLLNTTTIYVTHDQLEAMTMADKIVLFNDGSIQQVGKPNELYSRPANLFVAKFIGSPSMNFISVKINKEGKTILKHALAQEMDFSKVLSKYANNAFTEFVIGIRPEHVVISQEMPTSGLYVKCSVVTNELIGKETIISAEYGDKQQIRATVPGVSNLSYGSIIYAIINFNKVHIFDNKTEKRLN